MKRWSITFPGEYGQDVVETWTEDQIIKAYYRYWAIKMVESGRGNELSRERCIEDWCVIHWAWEYKDERTN